MTTVMPRPFDTIKWGLQSVDRALKQSDGQTTIPREALDVFKNFQQEFGASRNSMREAMAQEIRWMNDGRVFPGSIEPARVPKYDDAEKYHLAIAGQLQTAYRRFAEVLNRADNNRNLSYDESQQLSGMMIGLKAGIETLVDGVDNLRESKWNNKPAWDLFNTIKNQVNDSSNDTRFGPFGMLTKFGKDEAKSFLDYLGFQVTDWEKKQEVVTLLLDTAASPYGNLVLNKAAADVIKEQWGHLEGIDWAKVVDAFKDEHPIVALYAVAIDREINNPNASVRDLEAMLRAGEAAHAELGVSFATTGPVALAGAELPEGSAALAGRAHRGERGERVQLLGEALEKLREHIAALRAG